MIALPDDIFERLDAIARRAGEAILRVYAEPFDIQHKADTSPVTEADLAADKLIREALSTEFEEWPIISEESGLPPFDTRRHWSRYWLVDPLDGTREFVARNDEFTVNIALIDAHAPTLGIVHAPASGISWWGGAGLGARRLDNSGLNDINTRQTQATPVLVTSRSHRSARVARWADSFAPLETRPLGSSLKFCAIAEGTADVYPRFGPTSEWDTAAGQAVLEGAGGLVTDWQGKPLAYNTKADILNEDFIAHSNAGRDWLGTTT